jgi:chromosomal replication initiation ATPase DnaA
VIDDIQFIAARNLLKRNFFILSIICTRRTNRSSSQATVTPRHPNARRPRSSRFEGGMITDIQPPDFETHRDFACQSEGQNIQIAGK